MLSAKEKRFIKYWEEQRKGGRWPYFLLYIPAGTFMCALVVSFLVMMTVIAGVDYMIPICIASFVIITTATIATWFNNEKKFRNIIKREVKLGKSKEDSQL